MTGVDPARHLSPIPVRARPYQGRRAGVVTRFVGAMLDAVVVGVAAAAIYLGYAGVLFLLNPRGFHFPEHRIVLGLAGLFALAVVYQTAAWTISGRTYGGHVMGLRVVSRRNTRPPLALSFMRAVVSTIFPIGLFWCAVSRHRRSVADVLLRTSVVYDWTESGPT